MLSACTPSASPGFDAQENAPGDAWALYEALGETCTGHQDCAGGYCSDEICCTKTCTGPCESCGQQGFEGQCLPQKCAYPVPFGWEFQSEDSSENRLALKAPVDSAQSSCFGASKEISCPGEAETKTCSDVPFCGQDAQYAQRSDWMRVDRFVVMSEGWILDQATQLLWQDLKKKSSRSTSEQECEVFDDGSWRLAKREELMSLVRLGSHDPATEFPGLPAEVYWAQESLSSDDQLAWTVSFADGASLPMDMEDEHFVICLRARSAP